MAKEKIQTEDLNGNRYFNIWQKNHCYLMLKWYTDKKGYSFWNTDSRSLWKDTSSKFVCEYGNDATNNGF